VSPLQSTTEVVPFSEAFFTEWFLTINVLLIYDINRVHISVKYVC
jgi:hypothetical protein